MIGAYRRQHGEDKIEASVKVGLIHNSVSQFVIVFQEVDSSDSLRVNLRNKFTTRKAKKSNLFANECNQIFISLFLFLLDRSSDLNQRL